MTNPPSTCIVTAPAPTPADRWVPTGIAAVLLLLIYGAWCSTQPVPGPAELRPDAALRRWTISCASCHGPDGLGVTGRGGDVTGSAPADLDAARRLLEAPAHRTLRLSDRQVELVLEHLQALAREQAP